MLIEIRYPTIVMVMIFFVLTYFINYMYEMKCEYHYKYSAHQGKVHDLYTVLNTFLGSSEVLLCFTPFPVKWMSGNS